jgi:hypothetical protein
MCVHADVTGLTAEECEVRNTHAEELKDIVQTCLAQAVIADTRPLVEIRSSEVRPPSLVRLRPQQLGVDNFFLTDLPKSF